MARVGCSNYTASGVSPWNAGQFWRQVLDREQWMHPFHPLNARDVAPGYRNATTSQNSAFSMTWDILSKTQQYAGKSSYVHNVSTPMAAGCVNVLVKPSSTFRRAKNSTSSPVIVSGRSSRSGYRRDPNNAAQNPSARGTGFMGYADAKRQAMGGVTQDPRVMSTPRPHHGGYRMDRAPDVVSHQRVFNN